MRRVDDCGASFATVAHACAEAKKHNEKTVCSLDSPRRLSFYVLPEDDPHKIYHEVFPEYGPHPERAVWPE